MLDKTHHLRAIQAIQKKLRGKPLSYKEVFTIMDEIAHNKLGTILTTYFVAAAYSEGFSADELFYLTKAMVETGTQLSFPGIVADKHSIGGLPGTRTTMIVVPIIAASGFTIPKTSSRAITTPAGTADVMELFCNVSFTPKEIKEIVTEVGGCIVWGGDLGLAPADDVIIQVERPLSFESFDKIIISIMSKKIAAGSKTILLDIPYGKTMKVHTKSEANRVLAKFKQLGEKFHISVDGIATKSVEPAGFGVGPYLEAIDVMHVLEQNVHRSKDLEKRSLDLAGKLLSICYKSANIKENGFNKAEHILRSGEALEKFKQIVQKQGGKKEPSSQLIHSASEKKIITFKSHGTVKEINNKNINTIARILGAPKDKYAGIYLHKKTDEHFNKDEIGLTLYSNNKYNLKEAVDTLPDFPIFVT